MKSRWTTSDVIEMSPLQFKTSVDKQNCYALCFVDMTWKRSTDISSREYGDIQTCLNNTKVLKDIGKRNQWCIESVQTTKHRPHIGGSYSLTVPQELFRSENACGFENLVTHIKQVILDSKDAADRSETY